MTRSVAVVAWDLAVAVISIALFIATPVWLAMREIGGFHAIFILIGSLLAATVAIFRFQHDAEPWPIRIFAPVEMPTRKTARPSMTSWIRSLDWTGRAQRA
jgi:hypothetical protein